MSKIFALGIITATALAGAAFLEAAEPTTARDYKFCQQDYSSDMRACGFDTMEQCVAMISGSGGSCIRSPIFADTSASYAYAPRISAHPQR